MDCADEKRQLLHRHPLHFVQQTLHTFNAGHIDAAQACQLVHVGKTRLYQLRTRWLQDRQAFHLHASGGDQRTSWPESAIAFLREFVPLQTPCNFQLVADELLRLHGLKRARSSVEAYIKTTCPTSSLRSGKNRAATAASAAPVSANSSSTTAPSTNGGPAPKNKPSS